MKIAQNPAQMPPGFACIASIICGALVWVYIAAGWL